MENEGKAYAASRPAVNSNYDNIDIPPQPVEDVRSIHQAIEYVGQSTYATKEVLSKLDSINKSLYEICNRISGHGTKLSSNIDKSITTNSTSGNPGVIAKLDLLGEELGRDFGVIDNVISDTNRLISHIGKYIG